MTRTIVGYSFLFLVMVCAVLAFTSYERELFRFPSAINEVVRVTENFRGVRFLKFGDDSAVQSYFDTRHPDAVLSPYVRVTLQAFDRAVGPVRRVLVIGMGGGTQGSQARLRFPDADIDLIEVCPVVAQAAVELLGLIVDSRMMVHVQDGLQFVESSPALYDVIFIDAFNGIEPPPHLITVRFFEAVKNRLAAGGVVASNVVYRDTSPVYDLILQRMVQVFGLIDIAEVPAGKQNRVFFTLPTRNNFGSHSS